MITAKTVIRLIETADDLDDMTRVVRVLKAVGFSIVREQDDGSIEFVPPGGPGTAMVDQDGRWQLRDLPQAPNKAITGVGEHALYQELGKLRVGSLSVKPKDGSMPDLPEE